MHVDLHQRSADKRRNTPLGKGGVPEETYDVHYAMHKLGLCRSFRRPRVGIRKHNYPERRSDGHGTGLRDWYSVCGTVVHVVVFSTNQVEWNIGKTRCKNQKCTTKLSTWRSRTQFRDHLEENTHTPRSCMLASVAKVVHKTHRRWGVNTELEQKL